MVPSEANAQRTGPEGTALPTEKRRGLQRFDKLTLVAVVVVVVLISIPRLAEFARRENREDAQRLSRRLFQLLEASGEWSHAPPNIQALLESAPLAARRQLDDLEFLQGGELLRRHGYLFELVQVRSPESEPADPPALIAVRSWPWIYGQTGLPAYLALSSTAVFEHANPAPHWSGPDLRPPLPPATPQGLAENGWRKATPPD
jgi:hypothetical protein